MPSLSSSPRMRSAPQRGLCAAILPDKGGTRGRGSSGPPRAKPPERAVSCAMPAKNGRGLDEQDCLTPSWRHSRREDNHEALPGSPPNTTGELPLCDDKLLTKKRVLRHQVYAAANEIRGHPGNEPKKVDHVSVLHRLRADGICSQDESCSRWSSCAVAEEKTSKNTSLCGSSFRPVSYKASQPGSWRVGIRAALRMAFTSSRNPGAIVNSDNK